ncbi:type 1 glutamine amidotransferase domain-containing protein [Tabrizicola sp.]|uniref:type 1 glutamine amidotransferase domain-containing protein n=1 Tax=Tabrizicola sp. TaxID=2005166 RepID=UPI003F2C6558
MSATIDIHGTKRVLMIAANPAVSPVTGWPVGFWWAEVTHPWWVFTEAGYAVDIVSPAGGDLVGDGYSDPEDASGYSAHDLISLGFKHSAAHADLLKGTKAISDIDPMAYDAIFITGGQSPMVTMIDDAAVHAFVARAWEAGKIVAVICHGTCILLKTRLSDGELLVKGRTWTGFADSEEDFADGFVGKRIQPFRIEEEARKLEGTNFVVSGRFRSFALRDGNLITGQQQYSGAAAAELVVGTLGR